MKYLIVAAALFTTASSFAQTKTEWNCTSSFGKKGPIAGYSLIIQKEEASEIHKGLLYPNCPVCMVVPTELTFEDRHYEGTVLVYKGSQGTLSIALESLLPTRSHPAILVSPALNDGQPVRFTCEN